MAARIWPVDAVTGAPSYTGRALRQTQSPFLAGATTARPLGALSGVRPGTPSSIVSATSTTWTVTPFAGVIDGATAAIAGPYSYSFDTNQTGSVTAAGGSARVDRLDVQVIDPAEGGVSGANPLIQIVYTPGAPGLAAAPAQSHPLAQINVPASGGGSPTVTWAAPYVVAAGGIQPVPTTVYPATPSLGQYVDDAALGLLRWNGAKWQRYAPWSAGPGSVGGSGVTLNADGSISVVAASAININDFILPGHNVEITYDFVHSANNTLQFRMRAGGVDATGAGDYVSQSDYGVSTTAGAANSGGTSAGYLSPVSMAQTFGFARFINANVVKPTRFLSQFSGIAGPGSTGDSGGMHNPTVPAAFTGITILPGAGTVTGTVWIADLTPNI